VEIKTLSGNLKYFQVELRSLKSKGLISCIKDVILDSYGMIMLREGVERGFE